MEATTIPARGGFQTDLDWMKVLMSSTCNRSSESRPRDLQEVEEDGDAVHPLGQTGAAQVAPLPRILLVLAQRPVHANRDAQPGGLDGEARDGGVVAINCTRCPARTLRARPAKTHTRAGGAHAEDRLMVSPPDSMSQAVIHLGSAREWFPKGFHTRRSSARQGRGLPAAFPSPPPAPCHPN